MRDDDRLGSCRMSIQNERWGVENPLNDLFSAFHEHPKLNVFLTGE